MKYLTDENSSNIFCLFMFYGWYTISIYIVISILYLYSYMVGIL